MGLYGLNDINVNRSTARHTTSVLGYAVWNQWSRNPPLWAVQHEIQCPLFWLQLIFMHVHWVQRNPDISWLCITKKRRDVTLFSVSWGKRYPVGKGSKEAQCVLCAKAGVGWFSHPTHGVGNPKRDGSPLRHNSLVKHSPYLPFPCDTVLKCSVVLNLGLMRHFLGKYFWRKRGLPVPPPASTPVCRKTLF